MSQLFVVWLWEEHWMTIWEAYLSYPPPYTTLGKLATLLEPQFSQGKTENNIYFPAAPGVGVFFISNNNMIFRRVLGKL